MLMHEDGIFESLDYGLKESTGRLRTDSGEVTNPAEGSKSFATTLGGQNRTSNNTDEESKLPHQRGISPNTKDFPESHSFVSRQALLNIVEETPASHERGCEPKQGLDQQEQHQRLAGHLLQEGYRQRSETIPVVISSLAKTTIRQAACGKTHLLLLTDVGHVFSFGVGRSGQLGLGVERLFVRKPERVTRLPETIQIAAGTNHSVALSGEGIVYVWGDSETVGDACSIDRPFPAKVPKTQSFHERVTLVAAGFSQTMAVTEVGRVFAWGDGTYCEVGRLRGKEAEDPSISSGVLVPTEVNLIDGNGNCLPKITAIAAGARHSLLLGEDGRVYSFGDNLCGQCGVPLHSVRFDVPKHVRIQTGDLRLPVQHIAAGLRHSAAITRNHQLVLWGHSAYHKLIHTAPSVSLLEERFGVGVGHMGVSVKSGIKDCCPKPRLVYSLLHQRVTCICLGDEFTVVVTGNGKSSCITPTSGTNLYDQKLQIDRAVGLCSNRNQTALGNKKQHNNGASDVNCSNESKSEKPTIGKQKSDRTEPPSGE